jgi:hypothetical protein
MTYKSLHIIISSLVIDMMLSVDKVRSQDAVFGLAVNREGRDVAWAWLKVYNTSQYYSSR